MSTAFEDLLDRGLYAALPAAGQTGRLYYATDHGIIYRDNGAGWDIFTTDIDGLAEDGSPDSAADYVLSYDDSDGFLKKVLMDNLPGGGGGGVEGHIVLKDIKAANTPGGGATLGSWLTRTLNTEEVDTGGNCALAANQFTLDAGTYRIRASAPFYNVDRCMIRLQNITDAATTLTGTGEVSGSSGGNVTARSIIVGRFTIASSKTFEIQYQVQTTRASTGLGVEANFGVSETYTQVELWKE